MIVKYFFLLPKPVHQKAFPLCFWSNLTVGASPTLTGLEPVSSTSKKIVFSRHAAKPQNGMRLHNAYRTIRETRSEEIYIPTARESFSPIPYRGYSLFWPFPRNRFLFLRQFFSLPPSDSTPRYGPFVSALALFPTREWEKNKIRETQNMRDEQREEKLIAPSACSADDHEHFVPVKQKTRYLQAEKGT